MPKTTTTKRDSLVLKVREFVRRYVVLTEAQLEVVSHFVLHTHQFSPRCEQPVVTAYLFVNSAQKGSGKSMLGIDILGQLCRNFEAVNNLTPATLFRLTAMKATLGIDEVDMLLSGNKADDDLVGILNTGYRPGGYVPRADPKEPDGIKRYPTFSPKILIGIDSGTMRDTTRDRCIPINMKKATKEERETIQKFMSHKVADEVERLNQEIFGWSLANTVGMRDYEPSDALLESLNPNPRVQEVAVALLQVARKTGREKQVADAIRSIFAETIQREDTPEVTMLLLLRDMFDVQGEKIRAADLFDALKNSGDERFGHWTANLMGKKLSPFGIRVKPVRFGSDVQRGIVRGECVDAFSRYLS